MGNDAEEYIYFPGPATFSCREGTCCRAGDGAQNLWALGVGDPSRKGAIHGFPPHLTPPTSTLDSVTVWCV